MGYLNRLAAISHGIEGSPRRDPQRSRREAPGTGDSVGPEDPAALEQHITRLPATGEPVEADRRARDEPAPSFAASPGDRGEDPSDPAPRVDTAETPRLLPSTPPIAESPRGSPIGGARIPTTTETRTETRPAGATPAGPGRIEAGRRSTAEGLPDREATSTPGETVAFTAAEPTPDDLHRGIGPGDARGPRATGPDEIADVTGAPDGTREGAVDRPARPDRSGMPGERSAVPPDAEGAQPDDMERFLDGLRTVRRFMRDGDRVEAEKPHDSVDSAALPVVAPRAPGVHPPGGPAEEHVEISVGTIQVTVEQPRPSRPTPPPASTPAGDSRRHPSDLGRFHQRDW